MSRFGFTCNAVPLYSLQHSLPSKRNLDAQEAPQSSKSGSADSLGIGCCPRERPPLSRPTSLFPQLHFYFGSHLGDARGVFRAIPPMSNGGIGLQYFLFVRVDDGENDEDGEDSDYKFRLNPSVSIRLNDGRRLPAPFSRATCMGVDRYRPSLKTARAVVRFFWPL